MGGISCIGKTLVTGLAVDYAVGQSFGIVASLFTGAQEAAPPPPAEAKPACTISHQIKHRSFWAALAGAVVGAIVSYAVYAAATALAGLLIVGTGGLAAVAIAAVGVGAVLATSKYIGQLSSGVTNWIDGMLPAEDGPVLLGAPNVLIRGLPAARAGLDLVACVKHSTPPLVAEGSETVTINGMPASRFDDRVACGATLKQGVETVLIGGPPVAMVEIANEFSLLERGLLIAAEFLIPPTKGMFQGLRKLPELLGKGKNAIKNAFIGAKNMILAGVKKGPQLISKARNAISSGLSKLKGALKNVFGGSCNNCKPDSRKASDTPGTNQKDFKCEGGCPVDTSTGAVVETRLDFELGHTLRLRCLRVYDGQREFSGLLGRGWMSSFDEHLRLSFGGDRVEFRCVSGEVVPFDIAVDTDRVFNRRFPHFTLTREPGGFAVHDLRDERTRHFEVAGDHGRLARLDDAHGNHVELVYAGAELIGLRHSDGPAVSLSRARADDAQRLVLSFERTDLAGPDLLVRYVLERGVLVEADSTTGYHLYYRYDEAGRMVRWSDTSKTWATYEYDDRGRCVRSRTAEGLYSIDLEYDEGQRITHLRDGKGHVTSYHFNERKQLVRLVDPLGRADVFEYDRYEQLVAHTDPSGHAERYQRDPSSGLLIRRTDREGRATELFYDDALRVIGVLDPLEQPWKYERGPTGELVAIHAPDGSTHRYRYDARGQLTRITRTGGAERRLEYDEHGRLVMETDWLGHPHRYTYDALDRLVQARDPLEHAETLFYDPRDRLAALRHADGHQRRFVYDSEHNLTEVIDENGHTERAEYGAFDLQRSLEDGEGRRYQFDYDPDHILLTRVRAPDGREYHLERDAAGQVVSEVDYHGSATRYSHDAAGNLSERVNAVGQVVRYAHDRNGEVIRIDADGESTVFERDALGRLVRAENPASKLTWEYDAVGRVVRSTQNGDIIDYAYDAGGNCTQRTLRPGLWQAVPHTTRYVHDAQGQLTALELARDRLEIERDPLGRPTRQASVSGYRLEQSFDARGALTEQRSTEVRRRYTYDGAGNLHTVQDARWGLTEYRHDRSDRILVAQRQRSGHESFRYDAVGLVAHARRVAPEGERDLAYLHDTAGRLHRVGDTEHTYDEAGRLVRKTVRRNGFRPQSWSYRWDSLDRLAEVRTPEGQIWRYSYDPLGRRVRKYNPATRESVHFTWDGDVLLREVFLKPRGAQHDQQVVRIVHWQHEPGTFVPLARLEDGQLSYVVTDHLGTPKELVTPAGEVVWRAHHAVWGAVLATDDASKCPIRFQGQYEDQETGLYYNRFRYYDPSTSLYLSPDPIGLLGGLQPEAYVSNPTIWIDPLGLIRNPALYDHVTYRGIKNGKFYTGYASAPSSLGLTPEEIVSRRYNGNFSKFDNYQPQVLYSGNGVEGKNIARGLEKYYFDKDVEMYGRENVANVNRPVSPFNLNHDVYTEAAKQYLQKCG